MYKIAVIGDYDSIYGFAALGLDIFTVKNTGDKKNEVLFENAEAKFLEVMNSEQNYAVIFMTEQLYDVLENRISRYKNDILPCIIPIPGVSGNTGAGIANVKKLVEQAVGSDIIFGNE